LRLQPTFRFRLRPSLRPSPLADPPAMPSDRLPACAFRRSSSSTFLPPFQLAPSGRLSGSASVPNLRLSPAIASPGAALRLIFDRRLRSAFRPCLRTNPRRVSLVVSLRRCPPAHLRLASPANLPALPAEQLPTPRLLRPFGAAIQLTLGFRLRSTFRPCLRTQPPTPRSLRFPAVLSV